MSPLFDPEYIKRLEDAILEAGKTERVGEHFLTVYDPCPFCTSQSESHRDYCIVPEIEKRRNQDQGVPE